MKARIGSKLPVGCGPESDIRSESADRPLEEWPPAILAAAAGHCYAAPVARIHIVGASGSGTTTLGVALAREIDGSHLDTDNFFWLPTDPPFTTKRPVEQRMKLLQAELTRDSWVLSGSLMGWGDLLIPRFDLVVFLYVPPDVRLERIMERERQRYGADIDPDRKSVV